MANDNWMRRYLDLTDSISYIDFDIPNEEPIRDNIKEDMHSLISSLNTIIFKLESYSEPTQMITEEEISWGNGVEEGMAKAAQILRELLSNYSKE